MNFSLSFHDSKQCIAQQSEVANKVGIAAACCIFAPDGIFTPMIAVFDSAPVSTDKLEPLLIRAFGRGVTGDVVPDGFGFFAVAQTFEPDGDDASSIGEAARHGTCWKNGDSALFDASVLFDSLSITGSGFGERVLDVFEQIALVGFDLLEVFASFFDYYTSGFELVVQRIRRDGFPVERNLCSDQVLGGFELAVFSVAFFLEQ